MSKKYTITLKEQLTVCEEALKNWSKADDLKKENQELKDKLRKYDNTSRS